MPAKRIFLSHSANRDLASKPVLDELVTRIRTHRPEVGLLLDRETLVGGEGWRSSINAWCGMCDAAIVLVTPDSMLADYCQYEWALLGYRRATTPGFAVLPIYLHAEPKELKGKPHQLGEIQGAIVEPVETGWPRIAAWLDNIAPQDSPTKRQAQLLATLIRQGLTEKDRPRLEGALAKIGTDFGTWAPLSDSTDQFALKLIAAGLKRAMPALNHISFAYESRGNLWSNIWDLVASSWVDDSSAGTLATRTVGEYAARAVALNAEEFRTGRLCVLKASDQVSSNIWPLVDAPAVAADDNQLIQHVAAAVNVALDLDRDASAADRNSELQAREDNQEPVVVCLPAAGIDADWMEKLRGSFPSVTFFLLAGPANQVPQGVCSLKPDLPGDFEQGFWVNHDSNKKRYFRKG